MQKLFSVEELIVDDSFINYCNNSDPADISRWTLYKRQHPQESKKIEEARAFVLGIKKVLHAEEKEKALGQFMKVIEEKGNPAGREPEVPARHVPLRTDAYPPRMRYWWYAAAAVVIIAGIGIWAGVVDIGGEGAALAKRSASGGGGDLTTLVPNSRLETGAGEKRIVYLPDSTRVTMNAKSVLTVDSSFGNKLRLVKLEGEAFFDVMHNTASPFVVRLKGFDVKVLGTMFNVRSYAGDKTSETSLVKGKVEITLKDRPDKKILLKPNEKAVLSNSGIAGDAAGEQHDADRQRIAPINSMIKPLTISTDGSSVIETGWIRDRLEINDETFEELKNKLERQYGVNIRFVDEEPKHYQFTATFEKEGIDEVLKALQLSYPFNYKKNQNNITIGK